jgi:hypothetical protein
MSRGAQTFKQGDVTKALRAAAAAGVDVKRIEIDRAGKIVIVAGQPSRDDSSADVNEWDGVK